MPKLFMACQGTCDCPTNPFKVESEKKDDEVEGKEKVEVKEKVAVGRNRWEGMDINDIDPDEFFKDISGPDTNSDDKISSEATFTLSRHGFRGYKGCWLNEDGDYVGYDDRSLVVYEGSLDSDSAWNRQFCKRKKPKETSSEDEVSSHPPTKKTKSDLN